MAVEAVKIGFFMILRDVTPPVDVLLMSQTFFFFTHRAVVKARKAFFSER